MPSPPFSPGFVTPGDLYVDRATETIWLGVQLSDDPTGGVLLADINGFMASIAAALASANGYTDAQVATKAALVHTHTAAQITDFAAAVAAALPPTVGVPPGCILIWHGLLTDIGVGALAGWSLCDGSNGTPDLRDKFVIGAGNKAPGTLNSGSSATTNTAGSHTHVINGYALTVDEIPIHSHTATITGVTNSTGAHTHDLNTRLNDGAAPASHQGVASGNASNTLLTGNALNVAQSDGAHTHSVTVVGSTDNNGRGFAHTHTEGAAGSHSHTMTPAELREATPYMALAYIMKL